MTSRRATKPLARFKPPRVWEFCKSLRICATIPTRPTKVTCAGPLTFGSRIRPNNVYKNTVEIAEEFAHVINAELQALVEAGATFHPDR